jgi:hypothetical protein
MGQILQGVIAVLALLGIGECVANQPTGEELAQEAAHLQTPDAVWLDSSTSLSTPSSPYEG